MATTFVDNVTILKLDVEDGIISVGCCSGVENVF